MTNLRALLVFAGIGFGDAAVSLPADPAEYAIRVEAVVTNFEIGAMEDALDDGFVSFDGVTLKMLSPASVAGRTICVYFLSGSVARSSRLRSSGQLCRFEFNKNYLKSDQLFEVSLRIWSGSTPFNPGGEFRKMAQRVRHESSRPD